MTAVRGWDCSSSTGTLKPHQSQDMLPRSTEYFSWYTIGCYSLKLSPNILPPHNQPGFDQKNRKLWAEP